jgi:hypothetical protein
MYVATYLKYKQVDLKPNMNIQVHGLVVSQGLAWWVLGGQTDEGHQRYVLFRKLKGE